MMTARFFSGASLFALLIVDICCLPVKQGFNPSASYGGGAYSNAAPYLGSSQEAPSSRFAPGAAFPYSATSKGVSQPAYQPVPQREPSYAQSGVHSEPAASFGSSSSSSGPALSGYRGSSVKQNPASSKQPGAAFQPGSHDINWAVAPPGIFSASEEVSPGVSSSGLENVSPPGPQYQAGELSHFEHTVENGDYQRETEEQGLYPSPPMQASAGEGFTSQPQPESNMGGSVGGSWGTYPYYDYMFLTGQYPPGTVSHYSSSDEQGRDSWQDVHYMRYFAPYNSGPAQQTETPADPQSFKDPRPPVQNPVMAGYGQGGAAAGVSAPSQGSFMQPGRYGEATLHQAGGYNLGKGRGY